MTSPVKIKIYENIAWVTIDNPPVNATSTTVRAGLLNAIACVNDQGSDCALAALQCEGKTFVAGGDMSEFDAPPVEPHLPDIVNAIEASSIPFLAMLHGNVLGGGLEIAMACAFRIAKPGTRFGFPEVNVGLIPGAGGTQRAPRLLGMSMAIDMACLGQLKTADELLSVGGIDAISEDPASIAQDYIGKSYQPVSERQIEALDTETYENYLSKIKRAAKGKSSPLHNFRALQWSIEAFDIAQPKERAPHLELRQSAQSRALRHVFFAERAAAKPSIIDNAKSRQIQSIAIVGGGLMGCGIAAACLNAGYQVCLIEKNSETAKAAKENIAKLLQGALDRGKITSLQFENRGAALKTSNLYKDAAGADLAIEAVFEDMDAKQDVFAKLANVMRTDAILATNTSYLNPDDIFSDIENPQRCVGIHFFSPAHIMKLVEVVKTSHSSPETLATAFALASKLRKVPVLSGICDGFIGNRILTAYRRAAEYLLADGALPEQVDNAMRAFGMAMGPFEAQDLSGLQIAFANRQRQELTRDPNERYIPFLDRLCADGRFGQRVGRGWYLYKNGTRKPEPDPEVEAMLIDFSAENNIRRRGINDDEIQSVLLAAMANEGARLLDEGIAENDAAVDVVKVAGYGFPRWRGGPMHWASNADEDAVASAIRLLTKTDPNSWLLANRFQLEQKL